MQKIKQALLIVGILASAVMATPSSFAAITPISVSIVPPVQFPPQDFSITGARASLLWGKHRDVYGLDVGLLGNITELEFVGIGIAGVFNTTHGTTHAIGLQAAGIGNFNMTKTTVYGLQFATLTNYNAGESQIYGVQLSIANMSEFTQIYGVQLGVYNHAKTVYGLQIGLVNVASSLYGVQIGLINFNGGGPFKLSPIINIGF